nr:unnamed protein product [Callosobruchus analis]
MELIKELRSSNGNNDLKNYLRMDDESFQFLINLIRPHNTKKDTVMGKSFLATDRTFEELHFDYLMGSRTVSSILYGRFLNPENYRRTNFPNCIGSIEGKHIRLISSLHMVDSDYRFIAVDVGAYGRDSDSNIFNKWTFGRKLAQNCLNMPEAKPLPNTNDTPLPYMFLGNEAFPLNNNFMKPYPRSNLNTQRRIFNYRLSRSRRTVECAFGILSNKWRIFHTSMTIPPDFAVLVTKAAFRFDDAWKFVHCAKCNKKSFQ